MKIILTALSLSTLFTLTIWLGETPTKTIHHSTHTRITQTIRPINIEFEEKMGVSPLEQHITKPPQTAARNEVAKKVPKTQKIVKKEEIQKKVMQPSKPSPKLYFHAAPAYQSGIEQGDTVQGKMGESEVNGQKITLKPVTYNPQSNWVPITGKTTLQVRELSVEIDEGNQLWIYSIPVNNGNFSDTILIPFHGTDYLYVSKPVTNKGFSMGNSAVIMINEQHSSVPTTLLQSWMANYNENGEFAKIAKTVMDGAPSKDAAIANVTHWVYHNIRYNWAAYRTGNVVYYQDTTSLSKRIGVCQDMATIEASILRSVGIPTKVVLGKAYSHGKAENGSHMWDQVYDGSKWINEDPTWNWANTPNFASTHHPTMVIW